MKSDQPAFNGIPTVTPDELRPISESPPCGPSLEYDPDYALVRARVAPRTDTQYGQFIESAESPDWADIERDCLRLLLRTKDINALIWLCRARTRLHHADGLARGLESLVQAMRKWPLDLHPRLVFDGEEDHAVRANALAALADPEGLLGDVREIVISSNTAIRLKVHDVERAFATPRVGTAPAREPIARQLAAMHGLANSGNSPIGQLSRSAIALRALESHCRDQLGDASPGLQSLQQVLDLFAPPASSVELPAPATVASHSPVATNSGLRSFNVIASRTDTKETIRTAREWFEHNEPSSPVSALLKQAERLIGKRFAEIADSIPSDLLKRWDSEDESPAA